MKLFESETSLSRPAFSHLLLELRPEGYSRAMHGSSQRGCTRGCVCTLDRCLLIRLLRWVGLHSSFIWELDLVSGPPRKGHPLQVTHSAGFGYNSYSCCAPWRAGPRVFTWVPSSQNRPGSLPYSRNSCTWNLIPYAKPCSPPFI